MREGRVGVGCVNDTAHEAVGEVRRGEQGELAQRIQPSLRQDARLQDTSAGDHRREA
jgi:hypothetical protein